MAMVYPLDGKKDQCALAGAARLAHGLTFDFLFHERL
jgi:hypothetical protein